MSGFTTLAHHAWPDPGSWSASPTGYDDQAAEVRQHVAHGAVYNSQQGKELALNAACIGRIHGLEAEFAREVARQWNAHRATIPAHPWPGVFRSVISRVSELRDPEVREQTRRVMTDLRIAVAKHSLVHLPPLNLWESDDGSATVDWQFDGRRLAFTLEPDAEESGWHFVSLPSSSAASGVLQGGSLEDLNLRTVLSQFLRR